MSSPKADVRARMIAAMSDPLQMQIYVMVAERPGVTLKEIATRSGQPPRRVRHQLESLCDAGLVEVEQRTMTRNTREAHYRVKVIPRVEEALPATLERKVGLAMQKLLIADLNLALSQGSIGKPGYHAQYRFPGSVDEQGLEEIASTLARTAAEIEETMKSSAGRLAESDTTGVHLTTTLMYFETPPWVNTSESARSGWTESES